MQLLLHFHKLIQSAEEEVDEVLILPLQHATDTPASLMDTRT
jgi:hypothetical protein